MSHNDSESKKDLEIRAAGDGRKVQPGNLGIPPFGAQPDDDFGSTVTRGLCPSGYIANDVVFAEEEDDLPATPLPSTLLGLPWVEWEKGGFPDTCVC